MRFVLAVLMFVVVMPGTVRAEEAAPQPRLIEISDAYAYATVPIQKNGAVFATIKNLGVEHLSGKDLVVWKAESAVAERVELHTHLSEDGVMMMRKVEHFALPDGESLQLEPMGDHIMLFGLKEALKEGESFPLTIYIGDGYMHAYGGVSVDVQVLKPGTKPGDAIEAEQEEAAEEAIEESTE